MDENTWMLIDIIDSKIMLFSIVTVCYNSAKTLKRTLDSVLVQNYNDFEYIIVDGGSTDGTIDLIKQYDLLFGGRLKWKSEPDKGIYDAFNKGIVLSKGDYVWLVNSDDYIEPNALFSLAQIISQYEFNDYPIISGAMNIRGMKDELLRVSVSSNEEADRLYRLDDNGIKHPASLIPKRIYEIVGNYDDRFRIVGDMDWFQRAYKMKMPFLFIENVLTNMQNNGISNTYTFKVYKMRCKDMCILFGKKYDSQIKRSLHYFRWIIRITLRFIKHMVF